VGIEHASQLLILDPLSEEAHHKKMLLLACSGRRSAALAQFESCRQVLMDELGVKPSPELQETYDLLVKEERPSGIPQVPGVKERRLEAAGECPYRGLAAFREVDAPFFFGRQAFTERLHQAVRTQPMVTVIVGSSGSGKSSAVYAGLLPCLREEGDWLIADFRPGSDPFQSLSSATLTLLEPDLGEADRLVETGKIASALNTGEISLTNIVDRLIEKRREGKRLLLIADQFEELYTLCPERGIQRRFLDMLLEAVQAANVEQEVSLVLLLTLRADFMGQALAHRPFADALQEASLIMGPMNRDELRTAIEKPAELQGAAFEAGLVERLLDDVGQEPGNLPLLEFALTLLWERTSYGWMTHTGYEEIGRVEGALARYAGQVYEALDPEEKEAARQVFVQLVRPGEGTEDTRRMASRAEVGEDNWELVQRLADWRLVVTGREAGGSETVEVVHKALIQGWSQLREWIEADRTFRTWQERLRSHLRQWRESGEDEGALLRGGLLVEAESWLVERGDVLSIEEKGYIRAGIAMREQRQLERERRRRRVVVGLAIGLVVALGLALLAGGQWQRADTSSQLALARQATAQSASTLAVQGQELAVAQGATAQANAEARATAQADAKAQQQRAEDQELKTQHQAAIGLANAALREIDSGRQDIAVLLALEALENYPYTSQAEQALGWAVLKSRLQLVLSQDAYILSVKWSPDGKRLLTGSSDKTARVWDAVNGKQLLRLDHENEVYFALWSPDGSQILTNEADHSRLIMWDSNSGERLFSFEGHSLPINCAKWSPAGDRIASASDDGTARIWDAQTGSELLVLSGHEDWVQTLNWSPSGERILTTSGDHTAIIWDAMTGEPIYTLRGHTNNLTWESQWSPSGDRILTTARDGTLKVWDAFTGKELLTIIVNPGFPVMGSWSPSGDRILAGATSGAGPKVYDAATGDELIALYQGNPSVSMRVTLWSPEGDRILTAQADGSASVWDATNGEELFTLRGHSAEISSFFETCAAWSPDGMRVATCSVDGITMIWDLLPVPTLVGHQSPAKAYWSPAGDRVLSVSGDLTARLWDPSTTTELLKIDFEGTPGIIPYLSWSPSGDRFILGSRSGRSTIFDATTGAKLLTISISGQDGTTIPAWSPDGSLIAIGHAYDGSIRLWDAESGEENKFLYTYSSDGMWEMVSGNYIYQLEWSPSGDRILSVPYRTYDSLRVWDVTTGEEVFPNVSSDTWGLSSWSPNGKRIATFDFLGNIWDAETGEKLLEFSGHKGQVTGLSWSPTGERIASSGVDGVVSVMDLRSGLEVLHHPIGMAINSVDWSPDGTKILISYVGRIVILPVWNTTQELIDYAHECCVVRELAPADRQMYGLPQVQE
jgi:WD40 repeat protein